MLDNKYSTFSMSIPIVFQSFFQILFGLVDIGFLSYCSDTVVASVGYANQIISVVLLAYIVVCSAVSIVGAQYIGEKRIEDLHALSMDAITGTVIISLFLTIVLLLSNNYIIEFLNVPISMSNGTSTYLSVISVGLLFQGGNTVLTSIYRIYANGNYAMYVGILTNTLNILGDACVVFNPLKYDYDCIFGVAAATVVSNFIGFILMLYYYNCNISIEHIFIHSISADNVKILMKYGIPAAGENISYKISQLFVTVFITSLGSYILTSKIYAMNIMLFVSLIPNSIGIATGIIVGYLFGEKSMMFCLKNAIKISK